MCDSNIVLTTTFVPVRQPAQVQLYPNPTSVNVTLQLHPPLQKQGTLLLQDAPGRVMRQEMLAVGREQYSFNVEVKICLRVPSGMLQAHDVAYLTAR